MTQTHNQAIEFLTENGWNYDRNRPATEAFSKVTCPYDYDPYGDESKYASMDEALEYIRKDNPEAFYDFELIDNLNPKYKTLVWK